MQTKFTELMDMAPISFVRLDLNSIDVDALIASRPGDPFLRRGYSPQKCIAVVAEAVSAPVGCVAGWISDCDGE